MTKPWTPLRITKYSIVYFVLLFCMAFVIMALRPITTLHMSNCKSASGIVQSIVAHERSKDINIRIGDEGRYYINRGLEFGLTEADLKNKILGKEIIIHYADHWTPLDPSGLGRHVARVSYGDEIIFDKIIK